MSPISPSPPLSQGENSGAGPQFSHIFAENRKNMYFVLIFAPNVRRRALPAGRVFVWRTINKFETVQCISAVVGFRRHALQGAGILGKKRSPLRSATANIRNPTLNILFCRVGFLAVGIQIFFGCFFLSREIEQQVGVCHVCGSVALRNMRPIDDVHFAVVAQNDVRGVEVSVAKVVEGRQCVNAAAQFGLQLTICLTDRARCAKIDILCCKNATFVR